MKHQADKIYSQLLTIFFVATFSQPALSATKSDLVLMPFETENSDLNSAYNTALMNGLQKRFTVFLASESASEIPMGNLVANGTVKNMGSGFLIQLTISNTDTGEVIETNTKTCRDCDALTVIDELIRISTSATVSVSNKTDRIKKQYSKFQKLNINGNLIPNISSSWSCVLDNETDLIWEVKTLGGLRDDYLEYSWKKAHSFVDTVNQVEGSAYCGSREWRLPTRVELMSLIDHRFDPTINTDIFPNSYDTNYWTGEVLPKWRISAWTVDFSDGAHMNWNKHWNWSVRLVRNK